MSSQTYDAAVVGAGPNGLSAAITLASRGLSVVVLEAKGTVGGGARTAELTLPGFHHDICSAIHPIGRISPFFRTLPLEQYGLEWINPPVALAHPFEDGTAATLLESPEETARSLGSDGDAWLDLMAPFLGSSQELFEEILRPVRIPRHPLLMARFGLRGLRSCISLVRSRFRDRYASALFAGCAAHSILPLDQLGTASFGLVLALSAHAVGWPLVRRGSQAISDALASHLRAIGGEIRPDHAVRKLSDLPSSRFVLFDVTPRQLANIAGDELSPSYRSSLLRYRYGPGVFKIDWALDGPIPWKSAECFRAATIHLGPTTEEIARGESEVWRGITPDVPFVLVAQPSLFDPTRAPGSQQTGWAYCHVPHASSVDMTSRIEAQIERFAPGFGDRILARATMSPAQLEDHNPNMIGGDIGGGSNEIGQFLFRPHVRMNPYTTSNPRFYLCSSSTPPGGGVHGMSGYLAATEVLKRLDRGG